MHKVVPEELHGEIPVIALLERSQLQSVSGRNASNVRHGRTPVVAEILHELCRDIGSGTQTIGIDYTRRLSEIGRDDRVDLDRLQDLVLDSGHTGAKSHLSRFAECVGVDTAYCM